MNTVSHYIKNTIAILGLSIYALGFYNTLFHKIPTQEQLKKFDATHMDISLTGEGSKGTAQILIKDGDIQLRSTDLHTEAEENIIAAFRKPQGDITVLAEKNSLYFGPAKEDYTIYQLTLGEKSLITYNSTYQQQLGMKYQMLTLFIGISCIMTYAYWQKKRKTP